MLTTFTDEQRKVLMELGFVISSDLVSEVAYRHIYQSTDQYVVISPDDHPYIMNTTHPETALGTY